VLQARYLKVLDRLARRGTRAPTAEEVHGLENEVVEIQWQMHAALEELGKLIEPSAPTRSRCWPRPTRSWPSSRAGRQPLNPRRVQSRDQKQ